MSRSRADWSPFAKVVVVLAVCFGVGAGLCGLDSTLLARFRNLHEEFGPNTVVGLIGAWALVLSAFGLVISLIAWVMNSIIGSLSFGHRTNEPQKLFDDNDETKKDDRH